MSKYLFRIALLIVLLLPACTGPAPTQVALSTSPVIPSSAPAATAPPPKPTATATAKAAILSTATMPAPTPTEIPLLAGRLAMLDSGGQVRILDLDTGQTVETGMGGELLGWSPSGNYLLVRQENGYAVLGADGKEVHKTSALPQPPQWAPDITPNGNEDWLSIPGMSGTLDLLSFPSGKTLQIFKAGELGEDGQAFFRWSGGGYLALTQSLEQLQKGIPFGETFQWLAANGPAPQALSIWQNDGKCCGAFTISSDFHKEYDLPLGMVSSGERLLVLAAKAPGTCSSCAADGLPLIVQDGYGWLKVSTGAVLLPSQEAYAWNPLQPGLLALAEGPSRFTTERKRLALLDLWAGTLRYLTGKDQSVFEPAWSPDGRQIAYAALPAQPELQGSGTDLEKAMGGRAIRVYDLTGDQDRPVTQPGKDEIDGWPQWLPGGQALLFARKSITKASTQVRVIDLATGQERLVSEIPYAPQFCHRGCEWGRLLAYTPGRRSVPAAPISVLAPTPTPALLQGVPRPGWNTYRNLGYGFEFQYPDGWQVEVPFPELSNFIRVTRDSYALSIGFRRPAQNASIQRSGTGAGDFTPGGQVTFMGQTLKRTLLVYGGKVKAVFYQSSGEFTAGGLVFTLSLDSLDSRYEEVDIPKDVQTQVDQMIASFRPYQ